jgi:threonine/homoserine/homoserine lactone efflux protein
MSERAVARAPRWFESAVFQYANPKAWMLAAGTVGAYQGLAQPAWLEQALIVAIFTVCCVISNFIWAWLGTAMRAWLEVGSRLRVFNLAVGASLVLTAVWLWRGSA